MSSSREKMENKAENILRSDPTRIFTLSKHVLCSGYKRGRGVCGETC